MPGLPWALEEQGAPSVARPPASRWPRSSTVHRTCSLSSLLEKRTGAPCFGVLKGRGKGRVAPSAHEAGFRPLPGALPHFIC